MTLSRLYYNQMMCRHEYAYAESSFWVYQHFKYMGNEIDWLCVPFEVKNWQISKTKDESRPSESDFQKNKCLSNSPGYVRKVYTAHVAPVRIIITREKQRSLFTLP